MKNRGSIYFLTLTSSIILVMAVMGLSFSIIQYRRTSRSYEQIDQAHVYAQLGVRHAIYFTHQAPNWRNLLTSGAWMQDIPNGQGSYSVAGMDQTDGVLNNGNDPVQLACISKVNGVQRSMRVQTEQPSLGLLQYAVSTGGNINISNNIVINGDVACNGTIDKTGSDTEINGNVEVVTNITGTTNISGSVTIGIKPKTFPYHPTLLDYYKSRATPIVYQSDIQGIVLGSDINPFGTTNSNGLYMINCGGQKIDIRDCRIVGTLILINPRMDSVIRDGVNWQPARSDFPALIIDGGGISIEPKLNLDEAKSNTDFSLPSEPGFGSRTDVYPNLIQGVIYCDGNLVISGSCTLFGSVIATGSIDLDMDSVINGNASLWDNPPKQFNESYLQPVQGTWEEVIP